MNLRIKNNIKEIISKDNGSFYLYDKITVDNKINELVSAFKDYSFLYSMKSNPFPDLVKYIINKGIGIDAASAGEVKNSINYGAKPENIYYSAPGKTKEDIESSIDKCIIIADSYNELILINSVAKKRNIKVKVGIRLNPIFSMFLDSPLSSKFGIDEESLVENKEFLNSLSAISIVGIHIHLNSQILDEDILENYYRNIFEKAVFLKSQFGWNMDFINFGSGIGIPYNSEDEPLNILSLANKCFNIFKEYDILSNTRLIIESGRFLCCEAGIYITPVVDCKESRGVKYAIVKNGMNGFLKPTISELFKNLCEEDLSNRSMEPLFTQKNIFDFSVLDKEENQDFEKINIVGNLCTSADILATDILLPKIEIGDYIIVSRAGTYAYSLSPVLFSTQVIPKQYFI